MPKPQNKNKIKAFVNPIQDIMMMAGMGGGAIVVWKIIEGQLSLFSAWIIVVMIIAWYVGFYTIGFTVIELGLKEKLSEIGSRIINAPIRRIEDKLDKLLSRGNHEQD